MSSYHRHRPTNHDGCFRLLGDAKLWSWTEETEWVSFHHKNQHLDIIALSYWVHVLTIISLLNSGKEQHRSEARKDATYPPRSNGNPSKPDEHWIDVDSQRFLSIMLRRFSPFPHAYARALQTNGLVHIWICIIVHHHPSYYYYNCRNLTHLSSQPFLLALLHSAGLYSFSLTLCWLKPFVFAVNQPILPFFRQPSPCLPSTASMHSLRHFIFNRMHIHPSSRPFALRSGLGSRLLTRCLYPYHSYSPFSSQLTLPPYTLPYHSLLLDVTYTRVNRFPLGYFMTSQHGFYSDSFPISFSLSPLSPSFHHTFLSR